MLEINGQTPNEDPSDQGIPGKFFSIFLAQIHYKNARIGKSVITDDGLPVFLCPYKTLGYISALILGGLMTEIVVKRLNTAGKRVSTMILVQGYGDQFC